MSSAARLEPQKVRIRLIYGPVPPEIHEGEPTEFSLQDSGRDLHPGTQRGDGSYAFECELTARDPAKEQPVFGRLSAHGPASKRFLYLSWKRLQARPDPWVERIKIPLTLVTKAQTQENVRARLGSRSRRQGTSPTCDTAGVMDSRTRRIISRLLRFSALDRVGSGNPYGPEQRLLVVSFVRKYGWPWLDTNNNLNW